MRTLRSAGRAVTLTGLTLSAGVMTWMFSPLKFQVDMGILLLFIFLWNMVGALTLLPALAMFMFGDASKEEKSNKMEPSTSSKVDSQLANA
jgi:predicted RND superfamily exporter protein